MATYVALTTTGESGWYIQYVGEEGEAKEQVREKAQDQIWNEHPDHGRNIYVDTKLKNLAVLSKSDTKRRFPVLWEDYLESDD